MLILKPKKNDLPRLRIDVWACIQLKPINFWTSNYAVFRWHEKVLVKVSKVKVSISTYQFHYKDLGLPIRIKFLTSNRIIYPVIKLTVKPCDETLIQLDFSPSIGQEWYHQPSVPQNQLMIQVSNSDILGLIFQPDQIGKTRGTWDRTRNPFPKMCRNDSEPIHEMWRFLKEKGGIMDQNTKKIIVQIASILWIQSTT